MGLVCALGAALCGCPPAVVDGRGPGRGGVGVGRAGPVAGAGDVSSLASGDFHSCAIMKDRTVRCWGRNKSGELGNGGDADAPRPTPVQGLTDVQELALGANFSCARLADRTVKCWGSGRLLGDGRMAERLPPTPVPGLGDVMQLAAGGYMICALRGGGEVKCWGASRPTTGAPDRAVEVAVAGAHACARTSDGGVRCWGEGIWSAPAGAESFADPGAKGTKLLATGDSFACVGVEDGTVRCWGRNDEGELGLQLDADNHTTQAAVPNVAGAKQLVAAESHVCAVSTASDVLCWGANDEGELGRGTRTIGEPPAPIPGLKARSVALGADHGCALTTDGKVACWGNNRNGQLGDGTDERRGTPTPVVF